VYIYIYIFFFKHQRFEAIEEVADRVRWCRDTTCINIVAVQLFLSAFVTARFHGIRRGEIKNKRRESNAAIAINQGARRVPLVNSRKAREIARGIIRRGGWPVPGGKPARRTTVIFTWWRLDISSHETRREGSRHSPTKWSVALERMKWFTSYAIARGDHLAPLVRIIYAKSNTRAHVTW